MKRSTRHFASLSGIFTVATCFKIILKLKTFKAKGAVHQLTRIHRGVKSVKQLCGTKHNRLLGLGQLRSIGHARTIVLRCATRGRVSVSVSSSPLATCSLKDRYLIQHRQFKPAYHITSSDLHILYRYISIISIDLQYFKYVEILKAVHFFGKDKHLTCSDFSPGRLRHLDL